jgi:PAS domain S-box-containing protein
LQTQFIAPKTAYILIQKTFPTELSMGPELAESSGHNFVSHSQVRVLIVDREEENPAGQFQQALESQGNQTDTASSIQGALEFLSQNTYGLAIIDVGALDESPESQFDRLFANLRNCRIIFTAADVTSSSERLRSIIKDPIILKKPVPTSELLLLCENAGRDQTIAHLEDQLRSQTKRLAESEERLRIVQESSADGVWDWDIPSGKVHYSPDHRVLLGYESDGIEGHIDAWRNLVHPDDWDRTLATYLNCIENRSARFEVEFRARDSKGAYQWIQSRGNAVTRNPEGRALRIIGTHVNISARKRMELALLESEDNLRRAQALARVGSWSLNPRRPEMKASDEMLRILRLSRQEISLESVCGLFHPEDRDSAVAALHLSAEKGEGYQIEHRLQLRDGATRWVHTVVEPVFDPNGQVMALFGITQDVTGRKEMEDALRSNEQFNRTLVEHIPLSIFVKDRESRFLSCNENFARMLGVSASDVIGKDDFAFNPPEKAEKYRADDRDVMMSGFPKTCDETYSAGGQERWAHTVKVPYHDSQGNIIGVLGLFEDVSQQRLAEIQRMHLEAQLQHAQKMESVGRLAGGVAHDYNNVMGVILGYTEMALYHVEPDNPIHNYLLEIKKSAERSANLTRQLLAFARRQANEPRVLDINQSLAGMLNMLQRLIGEDISLTWDPSEQPWMVKIDPTQLDQILANLCVNARDAIAGVGTIAIETSNISIDGLQSAAMGRVAGDYVMLSVKDNGCGMSHEAMSHLFEPFFTTKASGKGTGLGLPMVYGIVSQNNGFLEVSSKPEGGTTIRIFLPRHTGPLDDMAASEIGLPPPRLCFETILLAEDEESLIRLIQMELERNGYNVLLATTPREAIRLAKEHSGEIHMLITDVVMPEMNGGELASEILQIHPKIKRLFISGYTTDAVISRGVVEDGGHFLRKPFALRSLTDTVRRILQFP